MHARETMRPASVPRTCEACGAAFMAWSIRARGCSKRCRLPKAQYPELIFEVSNGMTLCRSCHAAIEGRVQKGAQ